MSGTVDRGETVSNGNRVVDNRLAEASRKLNLTRHAVKGTKDILNKYLYSSVSGSPQLSLYSLPYFFVNIYDS